jgi:hypothetical protein
MLWLLGCASQRQALDEVALFFHDDLRWGRLPTAEGAVASDFREVFNQHHRGWGHGIQIQDMEVEQARGGLTEGVLRMRIHWLRGNDSTDLRETVVEEHWVASGTAWRLRAEAIIDGDPGLFVAPTRE